MRVLAQQSLAMKLCLGWIALVILAYAALAGVATFSSTRVADEPLNQQEPLSAQWRWHGDELAIKKSRGYSRHTTNPGPSVRCEIRPDNGPPRQVRPNYPKRWRMDWTGYRSWFDGSATVDCTNDYSVYHGGMLALHKWLSVRPVQVGFGVLPVLPLMVVVVTRGVRQDRAQRTGSAQRTG